MGIIGAILGDIAGSRWEMGRPDDLDWEHIELFTDDCRYTDDTVLTVATAYALTQGTPYVNAYHKFGIAYQNCTYGGAFKNWLDSYQREPYYSYGNGAAMRVAPVVDLAQSESDCVWQAVQSAMCTHNHPEGIKGAVVTAMCGWMAKKGASKREIEQFARVEYPADEYRFPVAMPLKELREKYRWNVTCQGSVPVAIRCFLDSENYESFLRNVISLHCDTDTLCAIGGGIAEEYYNRTGFNEKKLLEKYLDNCLFQEVVRILIS